MDSPIVLSLGSVNADFQVRVDRRPDVGETLLGHDFVRLGGGKAANVAFLARRLGVGALLLARVGDDELAEQALAPLRAAGVDLARVAAVAGRATGVSMIAVPPDGKKTIILAANANQAWDRDDAQGAAAAVETAPAGSVLVADYEVPGFVVAGAVEAASRRGLAMILDPSPADRVDRDILARVDVVMPDASETEKLTGVAPDDVGAAARAARTLVEGGAKAACVRLRDGGCALAHGGRVVHVPPVPVEVVDATGAGDAFAGALAVALLEKRPLPEAACFGAAAAHHAVTGYGSQPAYPTRERLDGLFRELVSRAHALDD